MKLSITCLFAAVVIATFMMPEVNGWWFRKKTTQAPNAPTTTKKPNRIFRWFAKTGTALTSWWEDFTDDIEDLIKERDWRSVTDFILFKGHITDLFPKLLPGDTAGIIKNMIKEKTLSPLIQTVNNARDKFNGMVDKVVDALDKFNLELIREYFDMYKEVMGIESNNPMEFYRTFPKNQVTLVVKLVKIGFVDRFPERMVPIDDKVSDRLVTQVKKMLENLSNKVPKSRRIVRLVNLWIDINDRLDRGVLQKPVTSLINTLDAISTRSSIKYAQ